MVEIEAELWFPKFGSGFTSAWLVIASANSIEPIAIELSMVMPIQSQRLLPSAITIGPSSISIRHSATYSHHSYHNLEGSCLMQVVIGMATFTSSPTNFTTTLITNSVTVMELEPLGQMVEVGSWLEFIWVGLNAQSPPIPITKSRLSPLLSFEFQFVRVALRFGWQHFEVLSNFLMVIFLL